MRREPPAQHHTNKRSFGSRARPSVLEEPRADRADRPDQHRLRRAAAARARPARGMHAARRRGRLHRRGDAAVRPRARREGRRPGRHQRRLQDRAAELRHRGRLPAARRAGRAGRHPPDGVSRGGGGARRRGRRRRGRRRLADAGRGREAAAARARLPTAPPRPRRPALRAPRSVSQPPLHPVSGAPDDARLPLSVRVLQRVDGDRDDDALPPRERRARRARDAGTARPVRRRQRHDPSRLRARSLHAHIPLGKHWIGQCSLAAVRRLENVQLMAASGCKALFVGFESIDEETTRFTGKKQNRPSEYRDTVDMLREHGISVWGSFVFGFDTDDPEVFDRTVEFAIDMRLTMANFAMLCPYPGTALYRRLEAEGRLTDTRWWLREYHEEDGPHFLPKGLTREQLRAGWSRAASRFFSYRSMWRRWEVPRRSSWSQRVGFWPLNVMQHRVAQSRAAAVAAAAVSA